MSKIKNKIKGIKSHPSYNKLLYWGKSISITALSQIVVQGLAFLCGILVIRLLPLEEYALYTLANTMLGSMTMLADVGVSNGVMAQGGKVWQNREKLGAVLMTGLYLRRRLAFWSLIVITPILFYLLMHNGASWFTAVLIVLSIIPAFYASLSDNLLEIVPKLHQDIYPLQKNQISVSIGRLVLSALLVFIFPWTFVAILASGIPRVIGNIKLRKIAYNFADESQKPDSIISKDLMTIVKRVLPSSVYFTFSGQISIWLISLFGTTMALAQVGALGRISLIFSLFGAIFGFLIIPRLARLPNEKHILLKKYLQTILFVLVFYTGLAIIISLLSTEILWVLGDKYSGLEYELTLSIIGFCVSTFAGVSFSFYSTRGWIIHPIIVILVDLSAVVSGVFIFPISNLKGVLEFNIYVASILCLMNFLYSLIKIKSIKI
ncbi:O-antigen/teichoic acid export membrane protein [Mariniflexile fucanivorans]|uniref:O-antigen/teichoic acid export membrane protein n=1 Tax=Mariniflexile fucanivorans TaxID=264023 RepID=A0A4V2QE48_9FLAO|nr:polysaccharide biosynthesis protein [Mariniflexile fucanivorans]TCL66707.1 O-antigen/teichoic acid export membrane protein [Mariniflexile fucanivorans]